MSISNIFKLSSEYTNQSPIKGVKEFSSTSDNGNDFNFLILEHFLDQSIKLRLFGERSCASLKEAHDSSTIISKIIGILNSKYNKNVPFGSQIEARKSIAKFIGLSSFKLGKPCLIKFGPNCAINESCCREHHLEGLKDAHEMFPKLSESVGINLEQISNEAYHTSFLALYADLKNQIVILELQLELTLGDENKENISHRLENLLETFFGPSMHNPYLKSKLQARAIKIRGLLEKENSRLELSAKLKEKFPTEMFELNMRNVLQSVYSKLPETRLNFLIKKGNDVIESELISNYESKLEPDLGIILEKERETDSDKIQTKKFSENCDEKYIDVNMEHECSSPFVSSKDTQSIVTDAIINKNISHNKKAESEPSSLFKGVVISGRFFRGILEPVDERFATIIEGRDVNVKQYLLQRKRKAAVLIKSSDDFNTKFTDKVVSKTKGNILLNSNSKCSKAKPNATVSNVTAENNINLTINHGSALMNRHNSAERISWETQLMESEPSESVNYDNNTVNFNDNNKMKAKTRLNSEMNKNRRGRRIFSEKEVLNLIEGIRRFGRDWCRILTNYEFDDRSNVDLKDKARNLQKLGLI